MNLPHMEDVVLGETRTGLDLHILWETSIPVGVTNSACGKHLVNLFKATVMLDLDGDTYRTLNGKRVRISELSHEGRHICDKCVDILRKARRKK